MTTQKPDRPFDVRVNMVEGNTVLVRGFDAFELDDIAALIWRSCDSSRTVEQIALLVVAEYEIDVDTARSDTKALVAQLTAAGLLE